MNDGGSQLAGRESSAIRSQLLQAVAGNGGYKNIAYGRVHRSSKHNEFPVCHHTDFQFNAGQDLAAQVPAQPLALASEGGLG